MLAVLAPVMVLGIATVWLADRHAQALTLAQAEQTIGLLSAHVVRSLRDGQPVQSVLPPDARTSL